MKKELFLILSFIAITPHMTKTSRDYPNSLSILVAVVTIGSLVYGYKWYNQPQEQPLPNNSEPTGKTPEPSDFAGQKNTEQLFPNNIPTDKKVPTEEELKEQNKPKPSISDLIKPKKEQDKPEIPGLPPINNLGDLYTKDEPSIQQDSQPQKTKSNKTYKDLLKNDKSFKILIAQIADGIIVD